MDYKKGQRVQHPGIPEWGIGEVLENSVEDKVRIFFVGAGEKVISLRHAEPQVVDPHEAAHPVLDNLKITPSSSGIRYQSLPASIAYFLEQFPEGFYGKSFDENERRYKEKAHELAIELLSESNLRMLLKSGSYDDICTYAFRVVAATNLIFPNEKMALKDGLATANYKKRFAESLCQLLYDNEDLEARFTAFSKLLEDVEAAKWTTATYFLYIVHPDKYMFVKPTVTQHAANLCAFDIHYRPTLNWATYEAILEFSEYLKAGLAELNPRDMIDVQSFMWCIAPNSY